MKSKAVQTMMPETVTAGLSRMGSDMCAARRARQITQADMASRIQVSRATYIRMENGDPAVSLRAYAMAAWVMGLEARLFSIFDPQQDPVFQRESRLTLPQRVRDRQDDMDLDF